MGSAMLIVDELNKNPAKVRELIESLKGRTSFAARGLIYDDVNFNDALTKKSL